MYLRSAENPPPTLGRYQTKISWSQLTVKFSKEPNYIKSPRWLSCAKALAAPKGLAIFHCPCNLGYNQIRNSSVFTEMRPALYSSEDREYSCSFWACATDSFAQKACWCQLAPCPRIRTTAFHSDISMSLQPDTRALLRLLYRAMKCPTLIILWLWCCWS